MEELNLIAAKIVASRRGGNEDIRRAVMLNHEHEDHLATLRQNKSYVELSETVGRYNRFVQLYAPWFRN